MIHPKKILDALNTKPKKALGQNFLIHPPTIDMIYTWQIAHQCSTVLEIGPGLGALTEKYLACGHSVWAFEKDPILAAYLRDRWKDEKSFHLHEGDILKVNFSNILPSLEGVAVIGNLPYSITTQILEHLFRWKDQFSSFEFLLQAEVVDRITAGPRSKAYGRLTLWTQSLFLTEKGPLIRPSNFFPVPDVDSRLVRLVPKAAPFDSKSHEKKFFLLTRLMFQMRRKTLRKILSSMNQDEAVFLPTLGSLGIPTAARPEDIALEQILTLAKLLPLEVDEQEKE